LKPGHDDDSNPGVETIVVGQEKSERYARLLRTELQGAESEEDVRLRTYRFLVDLTKELGINVKIYAERIVITGGRIDSLFDNIIFEFKEPDKFRTLSGVDEAVLGRTVKGGRRKGGLREYIVSQAVRESRDAEDLVKNLSTKIGVGFDGRAFVFIRFVATGDGEMEVSVREILERAKQREKLPEWVPRQVDGYFSQTVQRDLKSGLRYLYLNLRAISPREPLGSAGVSRRFGEGGDHFEKHLTTLYNALSRNLLEKEPHIETLYGEWERVFGKVYGDKATATRTVRDELIEGYGGIVGDDPEKVDIPRFIFSIHTYYNIILKLLVSELLSSLLNPFSRKGITLAVSDERFQNQLQRIVTGDYFRLAGVQNFFERGFFEWWSYAWTPEVNGLLREVIELIEQMEVTTSIIKPEIIGDMVKDTYHKLMPQTLRHLLGEYFTPDWLADLTIDRSGFRGKKGETFLDPACGSGTFLAMAIKRKQLANPNMEREDLIREILSTVTGFDLNPIAVIASKTNYLLALGDLTSIETAVKVPVFQADSILTPAVHAKQEKGESAFTIDTVVGRFSVPSLPKREQVEELLDVVKDAIDNEFSESEYLTKIRTLGYSVDEPAALSLFRRIWKLTEDNRNGLWVPILKNNFAPVYSQGQYDFVVGNPPWISWPSMAKSYRDLTLPIWLGYGIFEKSAYDRGTTHDNFAMAFVYVSADHYLRPKGRLCFVIQQTFFKSKKGGEGFRKFRITQGGQDVPLRVPEVIDLVKVAPFKESGVTNATAVMLVEKGVETEYPVDYYEWTLQPKQTVRGTDSLSAVRKRTLIRHLKAIPVGGTDTEVGRRSPWLTWDPVTQPDILGALGKSFYRGRKGVEPLGAKGILVLKEPTRIGKNRLLIRNDLSRGRLPEVERIGEVEGLVESRFVYPMISGRNIRRYGLDSCSYILLAHENRKGVHNGVPESVLKVEYTETYRWLAKWRKILEETRARNSKFYRPSVDPFYERDNVGPYTFATFKVAWKEQNRQMIASVVSTAPTGPLAGKMIVPDSKVLFAPVESSDEAHYLCAVLNSHPATELIEAYTLSLQRGVDILDYVRIPKFDPAHAVHRKLSQQSRSAHMRVARGADYTSEQKAIDRLAKRLFSM
jgi:SAM-dependent methyltransferase